MTNEQLTAFTNLKKYHPRLQVSWDESTGSLRLATGLDKKSACPNDPDKASDFFLGLLADLFPSGDLLKQIIYHRMNKGVDGSRTKTYRQYVGNARVVGVGLEIQIDNDLGFGFLRSSLIPGIVPFSGKEVDYEVVEAAIKKVDVSNTIIPLMKGKAIKGEKVVMRCAGKPRHALRYRVAGRSTDFFGKLSPTIWDFYVDRETGEIIAQYDLRRFLTGKGYGYYAGKGAYQPNDDTWLGIDLVTKSNTSGGNPAGYILEDKIDGGGSANDPSVTIQTKICQFFATRGSDITCNDREGCSICPVSNSVDNTWFLRNQGVEVDCHYYSGAFFRHLQAKFGQIGVNNESGQTCVVCAHHGEYDSAHHIRVMTSESLVGLPTNNFEIVIPCGDGLYYGPFCAEDIIAHEWVHAVLDEVGYWSGSAWVAAMNESICDAMATFFKAGLHGSDEEMWLLGKRSWLRNQSDCPAPRCLSDPTQGASLPKRNENLMPNNRQQATYSYVTRIRDATKQGHQPDHWMNRLDPWDDYPDAASASAQRMPDNRWAHVNCGIISKAIFLMTAGGEPKRADPSNGPRYRVEVGLGVDRSEQLIFGVATSGAGASGMMDPDLPVEIKDLRNILLEQLWCMEGRRLTIPDGSSGNERLIKKTEYLLKLVAIVNAFAAIGAPLCAGVVLPPRSTSAVETERMSECSPSSRYWAEASIDQLMDQLIEKTKLQNGGPIFKPDGW